jgi:prepilin peptidase CpaA
MRSLQPLIPFVPLLALLAWAAIADWRTRLIRNWLTVSLMLGGLMQSFGPAATVTPGDAMLGWLVGFGLLFFPFAVGAIGGGDVKLLAGIGAWVGPLAVFQIFCAEAVLGLMVVMAQAAAAGKLRMLFRNSAVLAVNLAHVGNLGVEHAEVSGRQLRSVDRPLPYAVPTFAAVLLVLAIQMAGGAA